MNAITRAVLASACVCGTLTVWGCDDAGRGTRTPVEPGATLHDGSRITGTFRDSVSVPDAAAQLSPALSGRSSTFEAVARRGMAVTDSGALVAIRPGLRGGDREQRFTAQGHAARIVTHADHGAPVSHVEVYQDGTRLLSADLVWRRQADAWVLVSRKLTVYQNGEARISLDRRVDATQLTLLPAGPAAASGAMAAFGRLLLPTPLEAQLFACWQSNIGLFLTSAAVAYSALQFYFLPNQSTFEFFLTAAMSWDAALTRGIGCWDS